MKKLLTLSLLAVAGLVQAGCDSGPTPAYSGTERGQMIARNWNYEWEQLADDTDYLLLLRPQGNLTSWDVYHRQ